MSMSPKRDEILQRLRDPPGNAQPEKRDQQHDCESGRGNNIEVLTVRGQETFPNRRIFENDRANGRRAEVRSALAKRNDDLAGSIDMKLVRFDEVPGLAILNGLADLVFRIMVIVHSNLIRIRVRQSFQAFLEVLAEGLLVPIGRKDQILLAIARSRGRPRCGRGGG